jgi:hypothetical protein
MNVVIRGLRDREVVLSIRGRKNCSLRLQMIHGGRRGPYDALLGMDQGMEAVARLAKQTMTLVPHLDRLVQDPPDDPVVGLDEVVEAWDKTKMMEVVRR